jgi:hypothetical protein
MMEPALLLLPTFVDILDSMDIICAVYILVDNDKDIDRKHDTIGGKEKNRVQSVREAVADSSRKARLLDNNTVIFHSVSQVTIGSQMKGNIVDTLQKTKRGKVQEKTQDFICDQKKNKIDDQGVQSINESQNKRKGKLPFRC